MSVAALVLAAGRSTRYRAAGGRATSKMLEPFAGEPLLRHPVRAALAAGLSPVLVVTGHAAGEVAAVLADLPVTMVHNPRFAEGLAASLAAGLAALPAMASGALVLLGDMPLVSVAILSALLDAGAADPEADAVVPVNGGVRGNPVLLRRALFAAAGRLAGDEGARRLLRDPRCRVREVIVADEGVRHDMDEPGAFPPP